MEFIVTIASLTGVVANIYNKKWCFVIWLVTNAFWVIHNFYIKSYGQSLLFFVYFLLAIWGLVQWKKLSKG